MVLEGSARCIKYLVFIFNFLFFVCGVGLMAVGIYVQLKVGDFAELSTVKYLTGSILIITVGAVIALVSFFGCCGAVKENRCFLCLFFVILLLILCAEVAGTSLGYIYRDKIELRLREDLNASLMEYGQNDQEGITKAYDILQRKEKCCGVNSYEDWQASFYSNGNHTIVPDSCCIKEEPDCGKPFVGKGENIYKEGCYKKVRALLKDNLIIIFGFGLAVAFIQVLAMVFAMVLICQIGKQGEFA